MGPGGAPKVPHTPQYLFMIVRQKRLKQIIISLPSQVRLNYKIKLNRTKSGATYMAQTLKGVKGYLAYFICKNWKQFFAT